MNFVNFARSIPGIGIATCRALEDLGILNVQKPQNAISLSKSKFDNETSQILKDHGLGIGETLARKGGCP